MQQSKEMTKINENVVTFISCAIHFIFSLGELKVIKVK